MLEEPCLKIKFPPYAVYGIFSGIIILISLLLSLFAVPEGTFVILKGVIGDKHSLVSLSFAALVVCGINLIVSREIYRKDRVASHILGALAVSVSAVVLLRVVAIIFVL